MRSTVPPPLSDELRRATKVTRTRNAAVLRFRGRWDPPSWYVNAAISAIRTIGGRRRCRPTTVFVFLASTDPPGHWEDLVEAIASSLTIPCEMQAVIGRFRRRGVHGCADPSRPTLRSHGQRKDPRRTTPRTRVFKIPPGLRLGAGPKIISPAEGEPSDRPSSSYSRRPVEQRTAAVESASGASGSLDRARLRRRVPTRLPLRRTTEHFDTAHSEAVARATRRHCGGRTGPDTGVHETAPTARTGKLTSPALSSAGAPKSQRPSSSPLRRSRSRS